MVKENAITMKAYAQRRGVTPMAVSRAAKAGRIAAAVVRDDRGRVSGIYPDLADQEWAANTDLTDAPHRAAPGADDDDDGSIAGAAARQKHWAAKLAELKYKEAAAELLPASDVERRLVDTFTACKTRLLAIPSRARQALPHLTVADVAEIESLIREALEALADG